MQIMRKWILVCGPIVVFVAIAPAQAEEGGSGHYMPGSMSSFVDTVPAAPVFVTRLNVLNYEGKIGPNASLPFGGLIATDAKVKSTAVGLTLVWSPEGLDLGENWNYAMATTIPFVDMDVSGNVSLAGGPAKRVHDTESGLGDVLVQPVMLSYKVNPDFHVNSRLTVYMPTGKYTEGKLANTGKNFWTYSPSIELMYLGKESGIEASLFTGIDLNTENNDTDYKSGSQFHFDGTLAQHFPLWGGLAGVGVSGFYYKQIDADSGDGANLGDFKAMTTGIGPVASYASSYAGHNITGELKWLNELDTTHRLKGDTLFFKFLVTY